MKRTIAPELSALGIKKNINPMLPKLVWELQQLRDEGRGPAMLVVDSGCGQLRHLEILLKSFPKLCLVDTELQLERMHLFAGKKQTIKDFIKSHYPKSQIKILSSQQFKRSSLSAGIVFSINVLDVTPPTTRNEILKSAVKNLSSQGLFAAIVPRNDSRTLSLCKTAKQYRDGYIFPNRNAFTFYKNWTDYALMKLFAKHSLKVVVDISNFRYACVICKKI